MKPIRRLFIAEKPKLGRAIAACLDGSVQNFGDWIACGADAVTWCFGHLLSQLSPQQYDPALKFWRRETLPIVPETFRLEPKAQKGCAEQVRLIARLAGRAESVVNAGDPDREGQLLVDEVLEHVGWQGPALRLLLPSFDEASVRKALASLCSNAEPRFRGMRDAALARSQIDWICGLNLTRALTLFAQSRGRSGVYAAGRVQTPTLALVAAREEAVLAFKPVLHYGAWLTLEAGGVRFEAGLALPPDLPGLDAEGRLVEAGEAARLQARLQALAGGFAEALSVERRQVCLPPPLPFALSDLQKEAGTRHGFGAKAVLDACQRLYEQGLLSYPRTDCPYLPEEQLAEAPRVLASLQGQPELAQACQGADLSLRPRSYQSARVGAHHAIIPTGAPVSFLAGTDAAIFALCARRWLAQFHPAQREVRAQAVLGAGGLSFRAQGREVLDPGWTRVAEGAGRQAGAGQKVLPAFEKGALVHIAGASLRQSQTTPPERFTEGALVDAMKHIQRHLGRDGYGMEASEAQKQMLSRSSGLGTEATRADIIERLIGHGCLARRGKWLVPTEKGRDLVSLCPPQLTSPLATADLEAELDAVARGQAPWKPLVERAAVQAKAMVEAVFAQQAEALPVDPAFACPVCGRALVKRRGLPGGIFGCSGYPECRYAAADAGGVPGAPLAAGKEGLPCPRCGTGRLVLRANAEGPVLLCQNPACGHAVAGPPPGSSPAGTRPAGKGPAARTRRTRPAAGSGTKPSKRLGSSGRTGKARAAGTLSAGA